MPDEKERFINTALLYQLNPWKREIHCKIDTANQSRKLVLVVGYEVYVKKAERTGLLDGWKAWVEGSGDQLKGVIEIYRKDWSHPFLHEVYWAEAVQTNEHGELLFFWQKMPCFQLRKVAISQGFRLAFSDEIGGIPYDGSELPLTENMPPLKQADNDAQVQKPAATPLAKTESLDTIENLQESIRKLTLDNQAFLKPTHVSWIITQLTTEKSDKQLKGLQQHVKNAIEEGKANATPQVKPNSVRRFPSRRPPNTSNGNVRHEPLKTAAGAEDQIF